jgi:hypothetical protein
VVSFHKRACGYDIKTEKIFCFQGEVIRAETTTHIPPDPGAALNWLKNRQPDKWRDKKRLEVEDQDGQPVAFPVVRVYSPKPEEPMRHDASDGIGLLAIALVGEPA